MALRHLISEDEHNNYLYYQIQIKFYREYKNEDLKEKIENVENLNKGYQLKDGLSKIYFF